MLEGLIAALTAVHVRHGLDRRLSALHRRLGWIAATAVRPPAPPIRPANSPHHLLGRDRCSTGWRSGEFGALADLVDVASVSPPAEAARRFFRRAGATVKVKATEVAADATRSTPRHPR